MAKKKTTSTKKSISKTTKRRVKTKKFSSSFLNLLILIIICFSAGFLTYATLDYIFSEKQHIVQDKTSTNNIKTKSTKKNKPSQEQKKLEIYTENQVKSDKENSKLDENISFKNFEDSSKIDESIFEQNNTNETIDYTNTGQTTFVVKQPSRFQKPKLVLIIDDVASSEHVRGIKKLNLKITPSFFPPSKDFPDTPKLAKKFNFYMIHLPLEAMGHNSKRIKTLMTTDNYDEIQKVIEDVRKNFPNTHYLNNHTGSKFTSNLHSMRMLLKVLKKYDFNFLDSKTIASTKGKEASKEQGFRYVYRDVFLDNVDNEKEIKKQLKDAIKIAKERGYAIAIGHPRKNTFKVLHDNKVLLNSVEIVYLDEIYEYYR